MRKELTADNDLVIEVYNGSKGKVKKALERIFPISVFEPDIMKRIKGFKDICIEMGKNHKDYICKSKDPDEQMANATKMALLVARCFNGGVELDWSNSNQRKYLIRLVYDSSSASGWSLHVIDHWRTRTTCGARFHFANPDHARYAFEIMPEIYITINNSYNEKN